MADIFDRLGIGLLSPPDSRPPPEPQEEEEDDIFSRLRRLSAPREAPEATTTPQYAPDPVEGAETASEPNLGRSTAVIPPYERLRRMQERFPGAPFALQEIEQGSEESPGYLGAFARTAGRTATAGASEIARLGARLTPTGIGNPELVDKTFGGVASRERGREIAAEEELAEASAGLPMVPKETAAAISAMTRVPYEVARNPLSTAGFWGAKVLGMAADPLEALPGGALAAGGRRALGALRRGRRVAGAAEEVVESVRRVPSHAGQAGESPEAIARVARGERTFRVTRSGEVLPIPNTVDTVDVRVNPGEAKVRLTAGGDLDIEQGGQGTVAQRAAISRLREGQVPESPPSRVPEGDPEVFELDVGEGLPSEPPRVPEDDVLDEFDRKYFRREDPKETVTERLLHLGQRVRDEMEDEYQPILRTVRESDDPQQVREMEELLQQVRAAPTRSEIPVLRHTSVYDEAADDEIVTGGSLLDVMKGHEQHVLKDAERYMAAQRNLELAERAQRGAPLQVSDESVADATRAVEALRSKYGGTEELDQIAKGYRDWSWRAQIEPLVRVGVYDEATARRITDENTLYAIFDRVDRDLRALGLDLGDEEKILHPFQKRGQAGGGGGPRAGSPAKRIHGGLQEEGKIQGIWESSALQAMRVKKFTDRQAVKNMLGRLGDEVEEVPVQRVSPKTTPVAQVLDEAGEAQPVFRASERGGNTFIRYENGQRIEYAAPGEVLDALGRLTPRQASTVLAPARLATQMLRAGAVEIPSFAVFNVLRDTFLAPIWSRHGMLPFYDQARIAGKEIVRRVRGKGPSEAWATAEEFGGFSTMMDVDRASMRRATEDARRLIQPGGNIRRFLSEWKRNPLLPFHVVGASLERLNRAAEASLALQGGRKKVPFTRIGIPGTLGKGGAKATKRSAGLDAADVTLNFMRGGRVGKPWNRYEAFSNAMLQDVSKFAREMKADPFGVTTTAMAYVGIPSMVNYALNRDDPEYQRLPEWEKALFYHPGKLENGWWIRVPRPLGIVSTVFGYGSHKSMEAMMESDPRAGKEFLEALVDTTPMQFAAKPLNLLWNIAQPAIEASPQVNYSQFRERPIVPRGQEEWPPAEQYGQFTSPTMRDLGRVAGLSPRRIQYVFESHTGTLGREGLAILDRLRSSVGGEESEYTPDAKDIPVVGRFLSRPAEGFSASSTERFYELTEEAMGARSVVRSGQAKVEDYPAARLGLTASRTRRKVNDLSDRIAQVRGSKLPDNAKKERIRRLEQEITRIVERYNEQHEKRISP